MPSEKLTQILLSKSPFSQEQISGMSDREGWKWVYANKAPSKEKYFEVCFTASPAFQNLKKARCLSWQ
jgi:hypothetical protein